MQDITEGLVRGSADAALADIVERFDGYLAADPDYSFQMSAYVGGRLALDIHGGPHLAADSLMVPYSASKNSLGLSLGLLVQRGLLDLDAPVAEWWPEFAANGKERVTGRQLFSHQAGVPGTEPGLRWDELLDHHRAADRLAATRPFNGSMGARSTSSTSRRSVSRSARTSISGFPRRSTTGSSRSCPWSRRLASAPPAPVTIRSARQFSHRPPARTSISPSPRSRTGSGIPRDPPL
jgi:hypothetical protein